MNWVLVLALAVGATPSATFPIFGDANSVCRAWNIEAKTPLGRLGQTAFVAGFLTSLNMESRTNQTGPTGVAEALAEINRLCAHNPEQKVAFILRLIAADVHAKAVLDGRPPDYRLGP